MTREQRYTIEMLLQTPMNLREIGEVIGVRTSTVSLEIHRLAGKEATQLASTAIEALLPYKDKIHTITADNGKEFSRR